MEPDGYQRQTVTAARWPIEWPRDNTVVVVMREDGSLRPLTEKQQKAITYLLDHPGSQMRDAGKAVGLSVSGVHRAVHIVGLRQMWRWDFPEEEIDGAKATTTVC